MGKQEFFGHFEEMLKTVGQQLEVEKFKLDRYEKKEGLTSDKYLKSKERIEQLKLKLDLLKKLVQYPLYSKIQNLSDDEIEKLRIREIEKIEEKIKEVKKKFIDPEKEEEYRNLSEEKEMLEEKFDNYTGTDLSQIDKIPERIDEIDAIIQKIQEEYLNSAERKEVEREISILEEEKRRKQGQTVDEFRTELLSTIEEKDLYSRIAGYRVVISADEKLYTISNGDMNLYNQLKSLISQYRSLVNQHDSTQTKIILDDSLIAKIRSLKDEDKEEIGITILDDSIQISKYQEIPEMIKIIERRINSLETIKPQKYESHEFNLDDLRFALNLSSVSDDYGQREMEQIFEKLSLASRNGIMIPHALVKKLKIQFADFKDSRRLPTTDINNQLLEGTERSIVKTLSQIKNFYLSNIIENNGETFDFSPHNISYWLSNIRELDAKIASLKMQMEILKSLKLITEDKKNDQAHELQSLAEQIQVLTKGITVGELTEFSLSEDELQQYQSDKELVDMVREFEETNAKTQPEMVIEPTQQSPWPNSQIPEQQNISNGATSNIQDTEIINIDDILEQLDMQETIHRAM